MDGAGDASFVMRCCKIPSPSLFPTEPTHHNTQERQNSLNLIFRNSNQTINGWYYIKQPFSGRLAPFSGIQLPDTWNVHQFSPTNAAAESPHVIFVCFRRRGELSPLHYLAIDAKLQISFSLICIQWFPVAQRDTLLLPIRLEAQPSLHPRTFTYLLYIIFKQNPTLDPEWAGSGQGHLYICSHLRNWPNPGPCWQSPSACDVYFIQCCLRSCIELIFPSGPTSYPQHSPPPLPSLPSLLSSQLLRDYKCK